MRNYYLDENDVLKHVRRRLSQDRPQHTAEESSPRKPKQHSLWKLVSSLSARYMRRKPGGIYTGTISVCGCSLVKELEQHAR
jgi:hypothetical protein